jgi:flagellar M-ring protein FliF
MSGFDQILSQLGAFWKALSAAQRVALLSIVLLTAGAVSLLVHLGQRQDYATLYANLSPEDSARIVDELSTQNVSYRLTHAGTAIQVPLDRVYDLRLEMASQGLPASGPVGFEVFDEGGLSMTPFQQRVRYRRALEGELGRTISRLAPVHWTRVHINVPERTVLSRRQQKPTASVVVSLVPGGSLGQAQGRGIAQLIAGAVEGLEVANVSILDQRGRILVRPTGEEGDLLAAEAMDVRRTLERELVQRAQALLDAALGAGSSVVTVASTIDIRRVDETQNSVDPDQAAVISEQRVEESRSEPVVASSGIPGTPTNVPGRGPGAEQSSPGPSTETVTRETINFDVTRATTRTVIPIGAIQRLSVAVLVDGTYATPEGAEGEEATPQYQPRTDEELRQISEIVKRAVGFDEGRGDVIEVQNLPFRSPLEDFPQTEVPFWERPELLALALTLTRGAAVIGGLLLLALLVIRPALRQLATVPGVRVGGVAATEAAAGAGETPLQIQENAELSIPLNKDQARVVAEAMRQWLRE